MKIEYHKVEKWYFTFLIAIIHLKWKYPVNIQAYGKFSYAKKRNLEFCSLEYGTKAVFYKQEASYQLGKWENAEIEGKQARNNK